MTERGGERKKRGKRKKREGRRGEGVGEGGEKQKGEDPHTESR